MLGDLVQDDHPGGVAGFAIHSGQQDYGPQAGEFAGDHVAHADVDLPLPGSELAERAHQAGAVVLVDHARYGQDRAPASAGDPQPSVVVGCAARLAKTGPEAR